MIKEMFDIFNLTFLGSYFRHYPGGSAAAAAKSLQSCPTLCNPIDSSPPGSPVPEIPQARYIVILTAAAAAAKSLQLCPTLCDPTDSSPPGSSVPGILQARILEWVAILFPRGSS